MICIFFAGCGKEKSGSGEETSASVSTTSAEGMGEATIEEGDAIEFQAEFLKLSSGEEFDFFHPKFYGDVAYFKRSLGDGTYEIARMNSMDGNMEGFVDPNAGEEAGDQERRSICCFDVRKDGSILALVGTFRAREEAPNHYEHYYFTEFDLEGKKVAEVLVEEGASFQNMAAVAVPDMTVDDDGNCLISDGSLKLFSSEGRMLAEHTLEQGDYLIGMTRAKNGCILVVLQRDMKQTLYQVDFQQGIFKSETSLPIYATGLGELPDGEGTLANRGDALLYAQDKAYAYQMETKKLSLLTEWSMSGVKGTEVRGMAISGEILLALIQSKELAILSIPGAGEVTERKEIVIATISKTSYLDELIAEFNRCQKKYVVKIKEYGQGVTSSLEYQDPANRMMMDVLGDTPPDMIDLRHFLMNSGLQPSLQNLVEKEYVEDLGPYLDLSRKMKREDMDQRALECCSHHGVLATIPTGYTIQTLFVSAEELGEKTGWTVDELIAYDKAHPEMGLVDNCSAQNVASFCIYPILDQFVDLEKGQVNFENADFQRIMEYAKTYPSGDLGYYLNSEEKLIRLAYIDSLEGIRHAMYTYFEGKGQPIGFPTLDGSYLSFFGNGINSVTLSMCKRSENKDGVWEFMEFIQEYELRDWHRYLRDYSGIPANKRVLEKVFDNLEVGEYGKATGSSYQPHALTKEERERIYLLLDSAKVMDPRMNVISDIFFEEINPYFAGDKSLKQIIDVISNRTRLYLMEN